MTHFLKLGKVQGFARAVAVTLTFLASSTAMSYASTINVNTATQSELESIKSIGPAKAKTIIPERMDGGHFQDANDLQKRVRGIGMKSVEKW